MVESQRIRYCEFVCDIEIDAHTVIVFNELTRLVEKAKTITVLDVGVR